MNIKDFEKMWKKWYDEEAPEAIPMPCGYSEKLNRFQMLCICRIIRPDRVINAVKNFIMDKMGSFYVQSPPIIYEKIYK